VLIYSIRVAAATFAKPIIVIQGSQRFWSILPENEADCLQKNHQIFVGGLDQSATSTLFA
jgi:hypothetical protein